MTQRRSLRSQLYRDARILGNADAAAHGPVAYSKRYASRKVYATSNSLTRQLLRALSLSR